MSYGKEVLDLEKEYRLLSSNGKEVWDELMEDFSEVAVEMGLSKQEQDAIKQRYMAEVVYNDLAVTNEYLNRTKEAFSQRKINKNKLDMQRMSRVYQDHYSFVKDIDKEITQRMNEKEQERKNNQKR